MNDSILKALLEYNCQYSKDYDNDSLPLVDVVTPAFEYTTNLGKKELELLAEHITKYIEGNWIRIGITK